MFVGDSHSLLAPRSHFISISFLFFCLPAPEKMGIKQQRREKGREVGRDWGILAPDVGCSIFHIKYCNNILIILL